MYVWVKGRLHLWLAGEVSGKSVGGYVDGALMRLELDRWMDGRIGG